MYSITEWNQDLDLVSFYKKAKEQGFENNSSQKHMIDCFRNEREWNAWILFYKEKPVGSVAAHSLDVFDQPSYRICARTCILTSQLPKTSLRTLAGIVNHQNYTAQFLIPVCLEWCPLDADIYITSNQSSTGSQRLVHDIFCPTLEKTGVLSFKENRIYRGISQSFWKVNRSVFFDQLNSGPRW